MRKHRRSTVESLKLGYSPLEERRLLATTSNFAAGVLTIQMNSEGDSAILNAVVPDEVTVNGSVVQNGNGELAVDQVKQIRFIGNNQPGQTVELDGFFDDGSLERMTIANVSKIDLRGEYELSGDFLVDVPSATGFFEQSSEAKLVVGGRTDIVYSDVVNLFNASNDFQGTFSATGTTVAVGAGTGIHFGDVTLNGSLAASVFGEMTQANGTAIQTAGPSGLQTNAKDITLLNSNNDFYSLQLAFTLDVKINDRNSIILDSTYSNGDVEITAGGDITVPYENQYEFNNNYLNSNPDGIDLVALGRGTFGDGNWAFAADGSLVFNSGALQEDYYVEMDVSFEQFPQSYNKLLDFKNLTSDNGFYLLADRVNFYRNPKQNMVGEMRLNPGQAHTIGLLRAGGVVTAYLDGKQQFFFEDTDSQATFETLNFFKDDFRTGGREVQPGIVEEIRISTETYTFTGDLTLNAGGDVDLRGATSFVGGHLSVRANDFAIRASTDLELRDVHIRNDANIRALGRIVQSGPSMRVTGASTITSNYTVNLSRPANNFVGPMTVDAENVVLADVNTIQLDQISAKTSVIVSAGGFIQNINGAKINGKYGSFSADEIRLGNKFEDEVSFLSVGLESQRRTEYYQEDSVRLRNLSGTSAVVTSDASIYDTNTSSIDVRFNAKFVAPNSIILGDQETDSVEIGKVALQSDGYVGFEENGDVQFVGNNWGNFIFIGTEGSVTDSSTASINGRNGIRIEANSVMLGEDETNSFKANTTTLEVTGDAYLRQIENILLTGTSVIDGDLTLISNKNVVDTFSSFMTVLGHLHAEGNVVYLGDQLTSYLAAKSFSFEAKSTTMQFDLPAVFSGESNSNYAYIFANGAIGNLASADVNVSGRTVLEGRSIRVGRKDGDQLKTGQIEFRSSGPVDMEFDKGVVIAGNSEARSLRLMTPQFIADANTSNLNVERHTRLIANSIAIGEKASDRFESGSLSFVATGSVALYEDDNMRLFGESSAKRLSLRSPGSITDDANAETLVDDRATLTAIDIVIGELATDCFDIAAGPSGLVTNGTNVRVTLGC